MAGNRRDSQKLDIISALVTLLFPSCGFYWKAQQEDTSPEEKVCSKIGSGY